jgi:bifunctional DNase/RNase
MWRFLRLARFGVVLALGVLLSGARDPGQVTAPPAAGGRQEVSVVGVFSAAHGQHGVMIEGKVDRRRVLMVIGAAEAAAIAVPLEHITPPRPLTHDLFVTLFGQLGVSVTKVVITDLRDNIYYATLFLAVGGSTMEIDSRPSDAIALAIRTKAPLFAENRVFDKSDRAPAGPPTPGERI